MPKKKASAKPRKPKKKRAGRKAAKSGAAGKREHFNISGKKWFNPDTGRDEILPPLDDFVADIFMAMPRWMIVQESQKRYGCAPRTVDAAIARIKADFEEVLTERRGKQVSRHLARLDTIYYRALAAKDFGPAVRAVTVQATLDGTLIKKAEDAPPSRTEDMSDDQLLAVIKKTKAGDPGDK